MSAMFPRPRRSLTARLAAAPAAIALGLLAVPPAPAVEFTQVQPAQSRIAFTYQQIGVKMEGGFRKFGAQLAFDPAQPAAARAAFDIDLASIDTGSSDGDHEVAGATWFNTKAFPTARFVTSGVKALGGNRYEFAGKLTIKGRTRDLIVPATFSAQGKSGAIDGGFVLRRGDFAIGEGEWAAFDVIANEVQVRFHIAATAQ